MVEIILPFLSLSSSIFIVFAALVTLLQPPLRISECFFISIPLGIAFSSYYSYVFCALAGGLNFYSAISCTLHTTVIGLFLVPALLRKTKNRYLLWIAELKHSKTLLILSFISWIVFAILLNSRILPFHNDTYHSGGATWGDMAIHLDILNSFVYGENSEMSINSLPKSPIFSGASLIYSFIPDYHAAFLVAQGFNDRLALAVPQLLLSISFVALLYLFAMRFTNNDNVSAVLSVVILLFSGGVGFYYLWKRYFFIIDYALRYDFVEKVSADGDENLYWFAAIPHILLPQRSATYAYPLVLSSFILVLAGHSQVTTTKERILLFVFAAVSTCLTPMIHTHSFVGVNIVLLGVMFTSRSDLFNPKILLCWICYGLIVLFFGCPQALLFFGRATEDRFMEVNPMWSDDKMTPILLSEFGLEKFSFVLKPTLFFLRGLSLTIPLAIVGTFFFKSGIQLRFSVGAWLLFLVTTFIKFQPWKYDNIKLYYIWLIVAAVLAGYCLSRVRKVHFILWTVVLPLLFLCTFSGLIALHREFHDYHGFYNHNDVQAGEWIKNNTRHDAIILTSDQHIHPANTIAGRTVYAGYSGWLYSHGYKGWNERVEFAKRVFSGKETAQEIKNKGINYIVVDYNVRGGHFAYWDEGFFAENFDEMFSNDAFQIYSVKKGKKKKN